MSTGIVEHTNFIELKEAMKSCRFWYICIILFNGIFFGMYFASVYKLAAQGLLSDHDLTLAGALGMVMNGSSRIMWASLQDRFGFKKVYMVLMLIQLAVSLTIFQTRGNAGLYTFLVCLVFTCEGGHFSMYPTLSAKVFGIQYGGQIMTILFLIIPVSTWASFAAQQIQKKFFAKDKSDLTNGYHVIFYIAAALTAINLLLLFFLDDQEMLSKSTKDKIMRGKQVRVGNKVYNSNTTSKKPLV